MTVPFDQRSDLIWFDGKLIPTSDSKISVLTHGLHYASCVFEGERAYGGEIFKCTEHSERLKNSGRILDFEIPYSADEIDAAKRLVVEKNGMPNCYVRAVAWRGSEQLGVTAMSNTDSRRHRPGNGRAISTRNSGSRASGSTSPSTAAPIPRPRLASPRPPAST
jgi:branched-subunit amino acid aminotransferase/4-amino-4-deoxychorismate lyase